MDVLIDESSSKGKRLILIAYFNEKGIVLIHICIQYVCQYDNFGML